MGHEAKGSLASPAEAQGPDRVTLCGGADRTSRYSASFEISMSLTRQGLDSLSQVLDLVFQYLRLLRNAGALEWVWQESADLAGLHWRFQEKRDPSSLVVNLASNLQLYPPKYVVSAPYTYETYDPDMISRVLEVLTPARADIFVASRDYVSQVNPS